MTRDFNRQRRDDSRPFSRDHSSNSSDRAERPSQPARPRLNREMVDRGWQQGARNNHPDYRSRTDAPRRPASSTGRPAPQNNDQRYSGNRQDNQRPGYRPYDSSNRPSNGQRSNDRQGPQGSRPYGAQNNRGYQGSRSPQGSYNPRGPEGSRGPQGSGNSYSPRSYDSRPSGGNYNSRSPQSSYSPRGPQGSRGPGNGSYSPRGPQDSRGSSSNGSYSPRGPQDSRGSSSNSSYSPRGPQDSRGPSSNSSYSPRGPESSHGPQDRSPRPASGFRGRTNGPTFGGRRPEGNSSYRGSQGFQRREPNPRWQSRPLVQRDNQVEQAQIIRANAEEARFEGDYEHFEEQDQSGKPQVQGQQPQTRAARPASRAPKASGPAAGKVSKPQGEEEEDPFWEEIAHETDDLVAKVTPPSPASINRGSTRSKAAKTRTRRGAASPGAKGGKPRPSQRGYKWPTP